MRKTITILLSFILSLLLTVSCFASVPDANVTEGRWEISAGSGIKESIYEDATDKTIPYQWTSFALDYGIDDNVGIGISYYSVNHLREIQYEEEDLEALFTLLLFPFAAKYTTSMGDIHMRYQFASEEKGDMVDAALIGGAGIYSGKDTYGTDKTLLFPEIGAGMTKSLIGSWLKFRLNIVTGIPAGIELAVKPVENLEITLTNDFLLNLKLII